MSKPEKSFDTGLRILEVLKILLAQDISKRDLINKLKDNPLFENVYTQEAFIKYFNTLELLDFKIEKDKTLYKVTEVPSKISFTNKELSVFIDLIRYLKKLHNANLEASIIDAIKKSLKFVDEKAKNEIKAALEEKAQNVTVNSNVISFLESLLADNQIVSITYKKNNDAISTINVELKEIIEKNNTFTIVCYNPMKARNKKILVDSIISVKQLPRKASNISCMNSVVFRLYGRLAKAYKIKSNETALDHSTGCTTISNVGEDKDVLIKRLLKYGEFCEIIRPEDVRRDFIKLTEDILNNLQEDIT